MVHTHITAVSGTLIYAETALLSGSRRQYRCFPKSTLVHLVLNRWTIAVEERLLSLAMAVIAKSQNGGSTIDEDKKVIGTLVGDIHFKVMSS